MLIQEQYLNVSNHLSAKHWIFYQLIVGLAPTYLSTKAPTYLSTIEIKNPTLRLLPTQNRSSLTGFSNLISLDTACLNHNTLNYKTHADLIHHF